MCFITRCWDITPAIVIRCGDGTRVDLYLYPAAEAQLDPVQTLLHAEAQRVRAELAKLNQQGMIARYNPGTRRARPVGRGWIGA